MAIYRAVIDTATGNLLRAGYSDFENDGSFDPATETVVVTDPILDIQLDAEGGTTVTHFDGFAFSVVQRNLAIIKTEKIRKLNKKFTKFLEKKYSPAVQRSLTLLLGEANSKAFTQRAANIQQGIDWIDAGLTEFYAKRDAVEAAIDVAAIDAIELDLDALDVLDPKLTLEGARAILE